MAVDNKNVQIFTLPLQFPCGPQSSCCGPVGQSQEQIESLKSAIEKETARTVQVLNITNGKEMKNHLQIVRIVRSFGPMALPIITLNGEVVTMGNLTPEQAISALREKTNQMQ